MQKVFETLKIEPERLKLTWISASEGKRYIEVVNDFSDEIKKLGPSLIKKNTHL